MFLLPCTIVFFPKFGLFVAATLSFAILFAMLVFPALAMVFGPEGDDGSLAALAARYPSDAGQANTQACGRASEQASRGSTTTETELPPAAAAAAPASCRCRWRRRGRAAARATTGCEDGTELQPRGPRCRAPSWQRNEAATSSVTQAIARPAVPLAPGLLLEVLEDPVLEPRLVVRLVRAQLRVEHQRREVGLPVDERCRSVARGAVVATSCSAPTQLARTEASWWLAAAGVAVS
eukprot:scaffold2145_cov309-Prasinococcus_capsulatus_cf.AAC.7